MNGQIPFTTHWSENEDSWLTPQSIAGREIAVLAGPWASKNRGHGFGVPVTTGTGRIGEAPGRTVVNRDKGMLNSKTGGCGDGGSIERDGVDGASLDSRGMGMDG